MTPYRAAGTVTSPPPAAEAYDPATYLPPRERDVLQAMVDGLTIREMARSWYVSEGTVKTHQANLYRRLGAHTGPQAVAEAFRRGILAVDPDLIAAAAILRQAAGLGYRLALVPLEESR